MLDVKKRKIARLAFQEARDRGIAGLRLETLAETTGLPLPLLVSLYPQGEGELCMDAVEYAGELWLERMEAAVRDGKTPADRLHRLIREYALGSDSHPEALDMYVDLWKRAKDGDGYIRRRLAAIYSGYKERFVQMARMHVAAKTDEAALKGIAQFLTLLSDVLHLQAGVVGLPVDFDGIGELLCRAVSGLLLEAEG